MFCEIRGAAGPATVPVWCCCTARPPRPEPHSALRRIGPPQLRRLPRAYIERCRRRARRAAGQPAQHRLQRRRRRASQHDNDADPDRRKRPARPPIMPGWLLTPPPFARAIVTGGMRVSTAARAKTERGWTPAGPHLPRRPAAHDPPPPARNRPPRRPGHITTISRAPAGAQPADPVKRPDRRLARCSRGQG
jgi:hypothetical protein